MVKAVGMESVGDDGALGSGGGDGLKERCV